MGFTGADEELFRAWAKFLGARSHPHGLRRLAAARRVGVVDPRDGRGLPMLLPRFHGTAPREVKTSKGGSVVESRLGKIVVAYRVPSERPGERLWMGLWGHAEPRFMVEIPWPSHHRNDPVRQAEVVESLLGAGFQGWKDKLLSRYLPLDQALLSSSDLSEHVLAFAGESFRLIARSGVFALPSEAVEVEPTAEA